MTIEKSVWEGKKVFVGIDVHRKTYCIACVSDELSQPVKIGGIPARPTKLIELLARKFPGADISTVYESGFWGFILHRALEKAGIKNIVVNPASIEISVSDKVKTDKRDSLRMGVQLSRGQLKGIRIPSSEQELKRLITRTREQLVKKRTKLGNQIKFKLLYFGLIDPDDTRVMSLKLLREYETMLLPLELKLSIGTLIHLYRETNLQIKNLEKQMAEQAVQEVEIERIYRSAPGIGPICARTFANELGDMSQFKSERALFGFLGMTPTESSSGEKVRRGNITKMGPRSLRYMIVEAAWRAICIDTDLKKFYDDLKTRRGANRAIVAVSRKLMGRVRSCFRQNCEYKFTARKAA